MNNTEHKKFVNNNIFVLMLRWLILLPTAFIGSWLVYHLIFIVIKIEQYFMYLITGLNFEDLSLIARIIVKFVPEILGHFAMGVSFVCIGNYIAPFYKKVVSYIMCLVGIILSIAFFFFFTVSSSFWNISLFTLIVSGNIYACYNLTQNEEKFKLF